MRRAWRDEAGNMAPLAVVAAVVLVSVLSFGVDQGIAYTAKDRQVQALDAARLACMDPTAALPAKFSEEPGRVIAELVASAIAQQGVSGDVAVWFYEAPVSMMPDDERLWIVGMQVSQEVPTAFGKALGIKTIPASSCLIIEAKPYASEKVWRSRKRICGCYRILGGMGDSSVSFTPMASVEDFPDEIADRIRKALGKG